MGVPMLAQTNGLGTATVVTGIITALASMGIAFLGYRLSKRTQDVAEDRTTGTAQGPYIDALGGWSRDIVKWWQDRATEIEQECAAKLETMRADFEHRLHETERRFETELAEANRRADYWRDRALGEDTSDQTPPPRPGEQTGLSG
jgi:hypothetical protein